MLYLVQHNGMSRVKFMHSLFSEVLADTLCRGFSRNMLGRTSVLSGYLRGAEFKFWPCTDSLSDAFYGFHQLFYECDRILCQITAQTVPFSSLCTPSCHSTQCNETRRR